MAFEEDCANGTLPEGELALPDQRRLSEHPSYLPAAGAQFVASKIEALAANEDLWNSTVFILDYDDAATSTTCRATAVTLPLTAWMVQTRPGWSAGRVLRR